MAKKKQNSIESEPVASASVEVAAAEPVKEEVKKNGPSLQERKAARKAKGDRVLEPAFDSVMSEEEFAESVKQQVSKK